MSAAGCWQKKQNINLQHDKKEKRTVLNWGEGAHLTNYCQMN